MSVIPQVETTEISDSQLDNVSGGLVPELVGTVASTAGNVPPVGDALRFLTTLPQSADVNPNTVTGAVPTI
jgi:hypothetical protein